MKNHKKGFQQWIDVAAPALFEVAKMVLDTSAASKKLTAPPDPGSPRDA
jgi:hypothetical protein